MNNRQTRKHTSDWLFVGYMNIGQAILLLIMLPSNLGEMDRGFGAMLFLIFGGITAFSAMGWGLAALLLIVKFPKQTNLTWHSIAGQAARFSSLGLLILAGLWCLSFFLVVFREWPENDQITRELELGLQQINVSTPNCLYVGSVPEDLKRAFKDTTVVSKNFVIVGGRKEVREEYWKLPERLRATSAQDIGLVITIQYIPPTEIARWPGGQKYVRTTKSRGQAWTEYGYEGEVTLGWDFQLIDPTGNIILTQNCFSRFKSIGAVFDGKPANSYDIILRDFQKEAFDYFWNWLGIPDHH